jgi:uncharacterized damage-inducible protein DinB
MTPIADDFRLVLLRDLEGLQREVALYPDDNALWIVRDGVTNSGGNLALHIAGNIQHFIGHVLGGSAFRRDRDAEFGRRRGTRDEIVEELRRAMVAVNDVLPRLTEADLAASFNAHPGVSVSTQRFLLHLCTHASFHLGQVGYLRRIVTGDARSTNTVSASRIGEAASLRP